MKGDPEQRAVQLGEYIAANRATVRAAAAVFGCSKSTVHKDVAVRLRTLQPELFRQVQMVLARNKAERHLRGSVPSFFAAVRPPGANTAADKRRHTSEQNGSCAAFFRFSPGCGTGSVRLFPTG